MAAVIPTLDSTTYLATSLDNHVRLMDMATGKMLNDFSGHANESYRCRACFGYGEASVVCGDEKGLIWAWDLLDVGCANHAALTNYINFDHLIGESNASEPSAKSSPQSYYMD